MKTQFFAILIATIPGTALAHPGHIAETGGHTHWLALLVLGGLGLALAGRGLTWFARSLVRRGRA